VCFRIHCSRSLVCYSVFESASKTISTLHSLEQGECDVSHLLKYCVHTSLADYPWFKAVPTSFSPRRKRTEQCVCDLQIFVSPCFAAALNDRNMWCQRISSLEPESNLIIQYSFLAVSKHLSAGRFHCLEDSWMATSTGWRLL
jgi:hypothetical protein